MRRRVVIRRVRAAAVVVEIMSRSGQHLVLGG
jgi:hypothetical protein